jgi:hypothetical protein
MKVKHDSENYEEKVRKTHLMKSRNQLQKIAFITATFPTSTRKNEFVFNKKTHKCLVKINIAKNVAFLPVL